MRTTITLETIRTMSTLPQQVILDEIGGIYGEELLEELGQLIRYYNIYDKGADFTVEGASDYTPADLRYKTARRLINKEARFLFSKPPDFYIDVPGDDKEQGKQQASILLSLIQEVLAKSRFNRKLVQAARDCFIAKRVAAIVNVDESTGISVSFLPALEFVYETDLNDIDQLTKLICFYTLKDSKNKEDQRIYRKKYWMDGGFCRVCEEIRNGRNEIIDTLTADHATRFPYIPAFIVTNDGLSGDLQGESEIEQLEGSESWYSRLSNADMDAERKSMNPIRYAVDMSCESTSSLSNSAGSFWDLHTDTDTAADDGGITGKVGLLESTMGYSAALATTLDRIRNAMHEELDVPDISPDALKGVVSSGKTLKAIYWGLIVRCDEKMLTWRPALEFIARAIIDGALLYPVAAKHHLPDTIPKIGYKVRVDNQYPLPEDETEEKQTDMQEVSNRTRSAKSYLMKWRNLSDDDADAELKQIMEEQRMFDDGFPEGEM